MHTERNGNSHFPPQFAELLAQARGGSSNVLGELFETCRQYLLAVAHRSLDSAVRVKVAPSDVVQETFLEAEQAFDRFGGNSPSQLRAWLRQILINNLVDHARSRGREARRQVPLCAEDGGQCGQQPLVDERPTPRRVLADAETASQLEAALERLSPDHQTVIRLRHQGGLPFEEIARRMDRTPNAAQKLWMRAVCQLRDEFAANAEGVP